MKHDNDPGPPIHWPAASGLLSGGLLGPYRKPGEAALDSRDQDDQRRERRTNEYRIAYLEARIDRMQRRNEAFWLVFGVAMTAVLVGSLVGLV